jgi:RNA polymerase sigma factor (sigma-70 family)
MAATTFAGFLQQLRKAMAAETLASHSDCQLIEQFLTGHDEAAFHALLRRHGSMVFRVCRRVLTHEQDAEDAFQATFLVLAREARVIRKHESIASWLHGVAYRLALNARKANIRRRKHEIQTAACTCVAPLTDEVAWKELRSIFDDELVKLPERLRAPLVLCYLEGLTQDEAAERLSQSKGTFRRNLERGRELLGGRLTGRGVTLSAALFAPLLSECAASAAAVPATLAASTTEAAVALAAGKTAAALASARALALAQGFVQPVLSAKVKCVCVLLFAAALAGFDGAALPRDARSVEPPPPVGRQGVANAAAMDPPVPAKVDKPKETERIEFRVPLLVLHAKVQTELKLAEHQVRRIREIVRDVDARGKAEDTPVKPSQPGDPVEGDNKLVLEKHKALQKELPEILANTQGLRLRQLERQAAGMSSFQDPENLQLLALTDEQRDNVRTIIAKAREFRPTMRDGVVVAFNYEKADKAAVQQILELLTGDQRKIWRDITGGTFPADVNSIMLDLFPPPLPRGSNLPPRPKINADDGDGR